MKDLDPRTKIIIVAVLSTLAVVEKRPEVLFIIWMATLALLSAFSISVAGSFKKLRRFITLFASLVLIQSMFSPAGSPIVTLGGVGIITTGGVLTGLSVILRMFIIISSALILSTSSSAEIVYGLVSWKMPYELAFMVFLAVRFLPVLMEEMGDSITAIQLSGADLKRIPMRHRISLYTYIFMPVVTATLLRARQISIAMESRAFGAYPSRTFHRKLIMKPKDWMVAIITLAAGAFVIIW
ncbi:MAG TPA: energy-coupling factor transporter transmembrane protein EcfT [Thermoanaerobacterales bacterium]|nr:energy-coupling factor transporter transmembrane protein EcfT [Thermoanaerobacterales bacterium]